MDCKHLRSVRLYRSGDKKPDGYHTPLPSAYLTKLWENIFFQVFCFLKMWLAILSEEHVSFCCLGMQGEKHAFVPVKEKSGITWIENFTDRKMLLLATLILSLWLM